MRKYISRIRLTASIRSLKCEFGSPSTAVGRLISNRAAAARKSPVAYLFAGYGNAGDHASYAGVREIIDIPGPVYFTSQVNSRSLNDRQHNKVLCIGGGGLLQPVFEPFWRKLIESKMRFGLIGVGTAEAPPHRATFNSQILKRMMDEAAFVFVRDHRTAQLCESAGRKVEVTFCPAAAYVWKIAGREKGNRTTLLNAVHPADLQFAKINRDELRITLQRLAVEKGLKYREIDHNHTITTKTLRTYQQAAVAVSSRLHGCIFSYLLNTPCLPISCDAKTSAFYSTHTSYETLTATDAIGLLKQGRDFPLCAPATTEEQQTILTKLQNCASQIKSQLETTSV